MRRFNPGNFYCGTTAEWTSCPRPVGAADIFLEMIMQPFPGFDGIVPDSSNRVIA